MADLSDIVVVSSEEEDSKLATGDNSNSEAYTGSVVSVGDESESDCEIVSIDDVREEKWRDVRGPFKRLNALLRAGHNDPRMLLNRLFGVEESSLPSDPLQLWGLLLTLLAEPTPRRRLRHINTLDKVIDLLTNCKSILVITGAGISVSCGIPDFRSRDGIYARLSKDYPDLSSPQAMFDMAYFIRNPSPFFKFAKEIFPGQFTPSLTHHFVALLEAKNKLLRNYTQNIDTLEQAAGITRLIQCHGSFASASCTSCKYRVPGEQIKEAIFAQKIPYCPRCRPDEAGTITTQASSKPNGSSSPLQSDNATTFDVSVNHPSDASPVTDRTAHSSRTVCRRSIASFGVLKPDIVFFGEDLSSEFHDTLASDVKQADLVLVMGSSLKVRPVSHIPNSIPSHVPQILINREPLSNHDFDVELLGDCDVIVSELCARLTWELDESLGQSAAEPGTLISLRELWESRPRNEANDVGHEKNGKRPSSGSFTTEDKANAQTTATSPRITSEKEQFASENGVADDKITALHTEQEANSTKDVVEISASDEDTDEEDDVWEVAASLPLGSFTRIPPNQYVFSGAEVYISPDEDMSLVFSSRETSCSPDPNDDEEQNLGSTTESLSMTLRTDEAGDQILERLLHRPESDAVSPRCPATGLRHRSSKSESKSQMVEPSTPPPTPRDPEPRHSGPEPAITQENQDEVIGNHSIVASSPATPNLIDDGCTELEPQPKRPREQEPEPTVE